MGEAIADARQQHAFIENVISLFQKRSFSAVSLAWEHKPLHTFTMKEEGLKYWGEKLRFSRKRVLFVYTDEIRD